MRLFIHALGMAALLGAAIVPAAAGQFSDRVYADSFGNLVIHSAAGYKRIIVGMGHAAEGYNATGSYYEAEDPEVVYLDEDRSYEEARAADSVRHCHRPPHRWIGRSYMYGLPDHVVPRAPLVCD
jgi:hypothetical protein